jgi:hypothetical protein
VGTIGRVAVEYRSQVAQEPLERAAPTLSTSDCMKTSPGIWLICGGAVGVYVRHIRRVSDTLALVGTRNPSTARGARLADL